jgi:hypothetical protein
MPASTIRASVCGSLDAGPIVATIFVRRILRTVAARVVASRRRAA